MYLDPSPVKLGLLPMDASLLKDTLDKPESDPLNLDTRLLTDTRGKGESGLSMTFLLELVITFITLIICIIK